MFIPPKYRALIEPLFAMAQARAVLWTLRGGVRHRRIGSRHEPVSRRVRKYRGVLIEFSSFFGSTKGAYTIVYVTAAYVLFERRPDTFSIPRLLKDLRATNPTEAARLDADLVRAQPFLKKVRSIRSKVFAHRSATELPEEVLANTAFSHRDMQALLNITFRLVGGLAQAEGVMSLSTLRELVQSVAGGINWDLTRLLTRLV